MVESVLGRIFDAIAGDGLLWADFLAFCDCGGRLAGSTSERAAFDVAARRFEAIGTTRIETTAYAGWRLNEARLVLEDDGSALACKPLLGSLSTPPGGASAEVLDLGRGTSIDFERHAADIPGRFVMVRHEYPFSATHVHRRRKYGWAIERGAAGFIIANPEPGTGVVSGSSGRGGDAGIPAVATDAQAAARLAAAGTRRPRVRLRVDGEDFPAHTSLVALELPGSGSGWVVLSAHLDGHDLAESAMDNGSGMAVALAVARALAPYVGACRRGLKLVFFSAEEWALAGSRAWLDRMGEAERRQLALNINLDTVAGDARLTALTSEFAGLPAFVREAAAAAGTSVGTHAPMMSNSDHYNFARHGVPALRLVAGFGEPGSNVRHILTGGDTRDKVAPAELRGAGRLAAALVWRGLTATSETLEALR